MFLVFYERHVQCVEVDESLAGECVVLLVHCVKPGAQYVKYRGWCGGWLLPDSVIMSG